MRNVILADLIGVCLPATASDVPPVKPANGLVPTAEVAIAIAVAAGDG
jgi:hypothetical protein